jgi:heme exporter protein A
MPRYGSGTPSSRPHTLSADRMRRVGGSTPHGQALPPLRTIDAMTSAKSMVPLLEARAVSFLRQDEAVFAPLDFQLHAGELVLVEGANGSGKTTLLRMLAGLLHVGSGELRWRGAPLQRDHCRGEILFLGHQLGIKADLTPRENLDIAAGLHGRREGVNAAAALIQVGLGGYEDEPTRRLSAGQKKRAALARLVLVPAALWLLDEPYANLDHAGAELVNALLQRHAQRGGAALVSSHQTAHFAAGATQRIRLHV